MTSHNPQPKRILVLMSDTGGGHRAAAEAIQAAADHRYPGELDFNLVDVFRYYTPFPFRYAPEIYPVWVNYAAPTWLLSYKMTNSIARSKVSVKFLSLVWQRGIHRMLREHPADMILSVHSIVARPVMKALQNYSQRPPFMTVVTDLVSTHAFWYDPPVDRCLVPTETAYHRGVKFGMDEQKLRITGLPVHPKFMKGLTSKADARQELGIRDDLPAVLLVSGGEGMGPLFKIAEAINKKCLPCQLLIVAGRNESLYEKLNIHPWNQPTTIYRFVNFMPKLMAAADMLVTKAGPATISEAFMAGLPIIISGAIPGQEDGNIHLVTENGIGVFAPGAQKVADAVEEWLKAGQDNLEKRSERAKSLAMPNAVWDIVDEVYNMAHQDPIPIVKPETNGIIRNSLRGLLSPLD